jgi:regulation of enolase protein 1 (concanavalin A-like superfamily)
MHPLIMLCFIAAALASDSEDREKWPLIFAAGDGDSDAVASLLAGGADVHQRSKDGETALHVAAIKGTESVVRALLDAGSEVDARTPKGSTIYMTPTMWATYHGHAVMVEMLLDAGADPLAADENGKTLLTMSEEAGQPAIESMLRARADVPRVSGLPALRWLNNRIGDASLSADGDELVMTTGKETDWFNPPPDPASPSALANAPALVLTPRAGQDWQFSARVSVEHQFLFDAATLFVYQGPNDWCKLCFELSPEKQPTIVSVVTRDISDDANGAPITGGSVHLRISKYSTAGIFAFHYSVDGGKYWTLHRSFTLRDPKAPVSVGMLAQAPTGDTCVARFSQIRFSETTLAAPRDGS